MGASRKTNRDHAKKTQRPMPEDEAIAEQLKALLTITAQENYCRKLGLRDRIRLSRCPYCYDAPLLQNRTCGFSPHHGS